MLILQKLCDRKGSEGVRDRHWRFTPVFLKAGFAHFKAKRFPLEIPFHGLTNLSISYLQFIVNLNVLLLSFSQLLLVIGIALGSS